jgi:glycerophosphoryl diester phosphodiesterase
VNLCDILPTNSSSKSQAHWQRRVPLDKLPSASKDRTMKLLPLLFTGIIGIIGMSPCWSVPLIVAHRGASADAPENTMAAFNEAWRQGADAIEGDFWLTKDGRIVTIHDATTKRTSTKDFKVTQTDWADLKDLDVGSWKGSQWSSEKMPLLSEVLASIPSGKSIFIEVKCGPEIVPRLFEVLAQSKTALAQITIISFNKEVIRALKKRDARITANWLTSFKKEEDGTYTPDLDTTIATLQEIGADGLGAQAVPALAKDLGTRLRQAHLGYHLWTIDDAKTARQFVAAGAQSVTTNKPTLMRAFLADRDQPARKQ